MDLSGINQFGSLTTQSGKKLEFKDFDLNNDGEISKAEFSQVVSNYKLDSLELSSLDSNKDEVITVEEFANFEIEAQMNEELRSIGNVISKDPELTGSNLALGEQILADLKEWTEQFKAEYTGDLAKMLEEFKTQLQTKYKELRETTLYNSPKNVGSRVLDSMLEELASELEEQADTISADVAKDIQNTYAKKLETLITKFIQSYDGENFEADLIAYVDASLNKTDAENMAAAVDKLNSGLHSDDYIDSFNEFPKYKEQVKEFLMEALNNDLTLRMNGVNIISEASIDTLLTKYEDADSLRADLNELIETFSDTTLKDSIINDAIEAEAVEQEKAFQSLTGEDVKIDTSLAGFDYSKIPGYNENTTTTITGQGADAAKGQAKQLLNGLKDQLIAQLTAQLEAKGIPFEKIEGIFNNVFEQSVTDTVNSCVSGKDRIRFLWITWRESSSTFNTKTLVDTFLNKFNETMSKTISEMNATNTDFDTQDIDISNLAENERGVVDKEMEELLENGGTITSITGLTPQLESIEDKGETLINRLKGTMLAKSMAMCEANDIEFDNDAFSKIFENTKDMAIVSATSGGILIKKFNPQNCVNEFISLFKTNYTAWVESEKQKV